MKVSCIKVVHVLICLFFDDFVEVLLCCLISILVLSVLYRILTHTGRSFPCYLMSLSCYSLTTGTRPGLGSLDLVVIVALTDSQLSPLKTSQLHSNILLVKMALKATLKF